MKIFKFCFNIFCFCEGCRSFLKGDNFGFLNVNSVSVRLSFDKILGFFFFRLVS